MAQGRGEGEAVDAAVIGGGFAGLTAALYLARGRRRVALIDEGLPRNRFAHDAHGLLGHDGRAPSEIRRLGRADVLAYPTVRAVEGRVEAVAGASGAFALETTVGPVRAARVILATGMRDLLPAIPGLEAAWGVSAVQCPYCHGFELADRPTGVLMLADGMPHHAIMLAEWTSDIIVLANGHAVAEADRERLAARGVRLAEAPVAALEEEVGHLRAARLTDGTRVPLGALYLAPPTALPPLAAALGLATERGPQGEFLRVDAMRATNVPGVWAAGDLTRPNYGAALAQADGLMAGTACHRSLMDFS